MHGLEMMIKQRIYISLDDSNARLLTLYDKSWYLHYELTGGVVDKQNVNGNKDFHLEIDENTIQIICLNGYFKKDGDSPIKINNCFNGLGYLKINSTDRCGFSNDAKQATQQEYPVGWIPYLADWLNAVKNNGSFFKYHDPSKIKNVGLLHGLFSGKLYGTNLMNETCEILKYHSKDEGHYSWVLNKEGYFLYIWNDKLSLDNKNYTK